MSPDSANKYGSRYGKRIRNKISEIEEDEKREYKCPECGSRSLEREGSGIWVCKKCGEKVSGGAWKPKTGGEKLVERALRKEGEE